VKPQPEIIIFTAPSPIVLIETIDLQKILPPYGQVSRKHTRFPWVANDVVKDGLPVSDGQATVFLARYPLLVLTLLNDVVGHFVGGLRIEPNAITGVSAARAAHPHVDGQVIWRDNAVTVQEKDVLPRTGGEPLISGPRRPESFVRMGHKLDGEIDPMTKFLHDLRRLVSGAIIRYDDFQPPREISLNGQREQDSTQMSGPLKCRDDYRKIGLHSPPSFSEQ